MASDEPAVAGDNFWRPVWARLAGMPWWPAVIITGGLEEVETLSSKRTVSLLQKQKKWKTDEVVMYYGARDFSWVRSRRTQVLPFTTEDSIKQQYLKQAGKDRNRWLKAYDEACDALVDSDDEGGEDELCVVCKQPADPDTPARTLIFCDGEGCNAAYHFGCLTPPLQEAPEGNWTCPPCGVQVGEKRPHPVDVGVDLSLPQGGPPQKRRRVEFTDEWIESCNFKWHELQLRPTDAWRMVHKKWLNDNTIDFYYKVLELRTGRRKTKERFIFAPTHFLQAIIADSGRVANRWWKDIKVFSKSVFFIPVNVEMQHWSLVAVLNCVGAFDHATTTPAIMVFMDSLGGCCPPAYETAISRYFASRWAIEKGVTDVPKPNWWRPPCQGAAELTVPMNVPKQRNDYDCGVYLLHFTELFTSLPYVKYFMVMAKRSPDQVVDIRQMEDSSDRNTIDAKRSHILDLMDEFVSHASVVKGDFSTGVPKGVDLSEEISVKEWHATKEAVLARLMGRNPAAQPSIASRPAPPTPPAAIPQSRKGDAKPTASLKKAVTQPATRPVVPIGGKLPSKPPNSTTVPPTTHVTTSREPRPEGLCTRSRLLL